MSSYSWHDLLPLRNIGEAWRRLELEGCDEAARLLRSYEHREVVDANGRLPRSLKQGPELRFVGAFMVSQFPQSPAEMQLTVEGIEGLEMERGALEYVRCQYQHLISGKDVSRKAFANLDPSTARLGLFFVSDRHLAITSLLLHHRRLKPTWAVNLLSRGLFEYAKRREQESGSRGQTISSSRREQPRHGGQSVN